jgi:hypothetical protein
MSIITIRCRLVAPEETLRHLWELMALKNTPLVNELLSAIAQHPDLETWLQQSRLPVGFIKSLCDSLKTDPRFAGQPSIFYKSAIYLVDNMYKSWFATQKRKRLSLNGKKRWLDILKSDSELEQESNCSLAQIRTEAKQILSKKAEQLKLSQKSKQSESANIEQRCVTLLDLLFQAHDRARTPLQQCAVVYLLKNNCSVGEKLENPEKYQQRRRAKEIEIERLEQQLQASLPKGRDLNSDRWLDALDRASSIILTTEELFTSQANLLKKSQKVPFPVFINTNVDLRWLSNEQERTCVKFNGLGKHTFEVFCHQRQLHWFQRFLADYETYLKYDKKFPTGLFALRSAHLVWTEGKGEGNLWHINHLTLHCSLETQVWTAEGIEAIRLQKITNTQKNIDNYQEKGELTKTQQSRFQAHQTSLNYLENYQKQSCSSRSIYQGNPSVILGVSIALNKPATVAVVDLSAKQVLAYRSTKQLLDQKISKDKKHTNYELLSLWHSQQQQNKHKRHQAQTKDLPNFYGESNLGLHINRLLSKSIVETAKKYQASTIVLPNLNNRREIIQSEIDAIAELKFPGNKEAQKNYTKNYRVKIHQWNYKQLIDCIHFKADKECINIEICQQDLLGNSYDKAKNLAFTVFYNSEP